MVNERVISVLPLVPDTSRQCRTAFYGWPYRWSNIDRASHAGSEWSAPQSARYALAITWRHFASRLPGMRIRRELPEGVFVCQQASEPSDRRYHVIWIDSPMVGCGGGGFVTASCRRRRAWSPVCVALIPPGHLWSSTTFEHVLARAPAQPSLFDGSSYNSPFRRSRRSRAGMFQPRHFSAAAKLPTEPSPV